MSSFALSIRAVRACLSFVWVLTLVPSAHATSIQQLSFKQVATQAQLVFQGEVIAKESKWNDSSSRIYTLITFRIDEVVKGEYSGSQIELEFSGGTVGDSTMKVQALRYPELGESGVYFVESISTKMVNPLLGWSQGHFKIKNERMTTAAGQPIESVSEGQVVAAGTLSSGMAKGVNAKQLGRINSETLSLIEFKRLIKSAASQ